MSHGAVELTADRLYRSAKVPYGFNYVDESLMSPMITTCRATTAPM